MKWTEHIARLLAPESFAALEKQKTELDMMVNQRVAEVLLKMDPFEPLLKKYNIIFSEEWERPEDRMDEIGRKSLIMWAYGARRDPSFIHLTNWIMNTQGNATLRKGKTDAEWFFGRAMVTTITLLVKEVGRLASKYEEMVSNRDTTFDANLPVGEY